MIFLISRIFSFFEIFCLVLRKSILDKNIFASFKASFRKKSFLACTIGLYLMRAVQFGKKRRKRRWWVRPWGKEGRREEQGLANNLIPDHESFTNFFR